MKKPRVAVVHRKVIPGRPGEYDEKSLKVVYGMLKKAVDAVGGMKSVIKKGDKVVVRANACWAVKPDSGIASDLKTLATITSSASARLFPSSFCSTLRRIVLERGSRIAHNRASG